MADIIMAGFILDLLHGLHRCYFPVGGAGGEHLYEGKALIIPLVFKAFLDKLLRLLDVLHVIQGTSGKELHIEPGQGLKHVHRVAHGFPVAAFLAAERSIPDQGGS